MEYLKNLYTTVFTKPEGKENFESYSSTVIIYIVIVLVLLFMWSYGAARLSYCYNMAIGNGPTVGYPVLAFIFSSFYYPYYGLFLAPCDGGSSPAMTGGRRRK